MLFSGFAITIESFLTEQGILSDTLCDGGLFLGRLDNGEKVVVRMTDMKGNTFLQDELNDFFHKKAESLSCGSALKFKIEELSTYYKKNKEEAKEFRNNIAGYKEADDDDRLDMYQEALANTAKEQLYSKYFIRTNIVVRIAATSSKDKMKVGDKEYPVYSSKCVLYKDDTRKEVKQSGFYVFSFDSTTLPVNVIPDPRNPINANVFISPLATKDQLLAFLDTCIKTLEYFVNKNIYKDRIIIKDIFAPTIMSKNKEIEKFTKILNKFTKKQEMKSDEEYCEKGQEKLTALKNIQNTIKFKDVDMKDIESIKIPLYLNYDNFIKETNFKDFWKESCLNISNIKNIQTLQEKLNELNYSVVTTYRLSDYGFMENNIKQENKAPLLSINDQSAWLKEEEEKYKEENKK